LEEYLHSNVHGIAKYAKTSISTSRVLFKDHLQDIHTLAVEDDGIVIVNVYKPPSTNWSNDILELFPHTTIYVGDFNQLWGYEHNNTSGNLLLEWWMILSTFQKIRERFTQQGGEKITRQICQLLLEAL
jgi:hypothetical protein